MPKDFRFAAKMPRAISHQARVHDGAPTLRAFLAQVDRLGEKRDCQLLQLLPSLAYQPATALTFFDELRRLHEGPAASASS